MKIRTKCAAVIILTLVLVSGLTGCSHGNSDKPHAHTYSEEWTHDVTYHWHAATCEHTGEISGKAKHHFTQKGDVVICDDCGFTARPYTVEAFLTALGTEVEHITANEAAEPGITYNAATKTANVYGVLLTGQFMYIEESESIISMPDSLITADLRGLNTTGVTNMSCMFYDCSDLTTLDLSGFDTSNVTNMYSMFYDCSHLTTLDLSGFDTSNVTDMSFMFFFCRMLTTLDVSCFETADVTDMSFMFFSCYSLTTLDVSGFDTSSVTDMTNMFRDCSSLTTLDLSGFDTSSVTDIKEMFSGCGNLTSLNLTGFDTSCVTDMTMMFYNCRNLATLDLSSFDTSKVTNMPSMFYNCRNLTTLDLSSFDTSKVTNTALMFVNTGSGTNGVTISYKGSTWTLGTDTSSSGWDNTKLIFVDAEP